MGCSSSNIRHLSDNPQWPTNRPIDDRRATLFFFVNGSSGGNAAAKLLQLQVRESMPALSCTPETQHKHIYINSNQHT
jgi:hypothetical protein